MSAPHGFQVLPATIDDVEGITDLTISIRHAALLPYIYAKCSDKVLHDYYSLVWQRSFADPEVCLYEKVVDTETGQLVAFSRWAHITKPSGEKAVPPISRPECAHKDTADQHGRLTKVHMGQITANMAEYIELQGLGVRSDYWRRGLAGMLFRDGIRKVNPHRLPIVIGATQEGAALYAKHGWQTCSTLSLDDPYSKLEPFVESFMLRTDFGTSA